ncbi:MAG: stringent starvation protein A [Gammaproteobacteria bacterium]|nr:stringent starvation protein A [Gammaproteobacteria bacterium]
MSRNNYSLLDRQFTLKLYSAPSCPQCHRVRFVLSEKELDYETILVEGGSKPPELAEINPYNSVPTLVDRDIVLYDARIILEYLDERYPHPPLIPADPITRATFRQALYHLEVDWYSQVKKLSSPSKRIADSAKKVMHEMLMANASSFKAHRYFWDEEFSMLDCSIAPILWRLPSLKVDMPKKSSHPIRQYAMRIFERPTFRKSLTEIELELGKTR